MDIFSSRPHAAAAKPLGAQDRASRLRVDSPVGHLLRHPAFAGFARLTLPWDDRAYDEAMPLKDLGTLLPFHSEVNPGIVVASLNRLIDDVAAGRNIFHDIYTAAEKQKEPTLQHTGLFFFRGKPGAPFAVIAPGGAFTHVASVHEGFPYAVEINNRGYNAFVLKYRAGQGGLVPTRDMAAAIAYVFRNAATLGVSTQGYSVWGSSAGARMAASIGSHGTSQFGAPSHPKPSTVVMAYTAHAEVGPNEPPTFVVIGERDTIVPVASMERRVGALRRSGTEVEFRKYPALGHGFGPAVGTEAEGWIAAAVGFWARQIDSLGPSAR